MNERPPAWVIVLVWVVVLGITWWLVTRWIEVGDAVRPS